MSIADTIYRLVPDPVFLYLRNLYRKYQQFRYPKQSESQFKKILTEELGIKKGMLVYVHSSVDKLNLDFSPFRLLEILLETIGEEGTIAFPCWHYRGRAADYLNKEDAVFDVKKSPTTMGLLPELARRHPNAFRSLNPIASVVAIGKLAEELTKDHHLDIYPNGMMSPLYKLMNYDSLIIGLGEREVSLSFVHVIEDFMKEKFPFKVLDEDIFSCMVIDKKGKSIKVETLVPHINITKRNIPLFFANHISGNSFHPVRKNGVNYFSVQPRLLFEEMEKLAEMGTTIYSV